MRLTEKEARLVIFLRRDVGLTWRRLADVWAAYEGEVPGEIELRDRSIGYKAQQAWGQGLVGVAEEVLGYELGSTDRGHHGSN